MNIVIVEFLTIWFVYIGMSTKVSTTNECIFVVSRDRNRSLTRIIIILKIVRASEETFIFVAMSIE